MAIQTYAPDKPTTLGVVPTKRESLSAADTFTFVNDGKTRLRVLAGSTETKIKVKVQQAVDGLTPAPREIVVKEQTKEIGVFDKSIYNSPEDKVEFTITSATGVVIELVKI